MDTTEIPLSLYIHFPWCVRKCPYCDFNSHALRGAVPEQDYIAALLRDLEFDLRAGESRPLRSIFMGGGTPSLFSGGAISSLLEQVEKRIAFAPSIEITLEANPGTAEAENFRAYRAGGVNRLSMGVQSLDDAQLRKLGRVHGSAEARKAYEMARAAGFDNINLDLMFALPGQTLADAQADIAGLIALGPEHISYYQLTLEPNTEFHARPPALPDDELAWDIQQHGQRALAAAGYAQYEVSAYAREGRQAAHNLNYWQFGDYLAIGAGAHGKLSRDDGLRRFAKHKHPRTYLETAGTAAGLQEDRVVGAAEMPFEFMMNALRLNEGISSELMRQRSGLTEEALADTLAEVRRQGLLEGEAIRPTELGRRHLNRLLGAFLEA